MSAVVLRGDAAHLPLPGASVDLIMCSPPYFGLRSYTDTVKCLACIDMERDGRDPRQAWPDYAAHVREVHQQHYDGQIGSEATPAGYIAALLACTREWVRVLKPSGSIFINLGDKYSGAQQQTHGRESAESSADYWRRTDPKRTGIPNKSLMGLPWRYALACIDDLGLILRAEIVWAKPNGLPESVTDRVRRSHEQVFHFTRQPRYYSAVDEVREAHTGPSFHGRAGIGTSRREQANQAVIKAGFTEHRDYNPLGKLPGSVWEIPSAPLTVPAHLGVDHFAAYPPALVRRIVLGWSPAGVCTACGEGRRPVVSATRIGSGRMWDASGRGVVDRLPRTHDERTSRHHVGYACACPQPDAPARPGVVLDPFGGTGTTALVAAVHGRTGISVDMSADYCRLARWRVSDPAERARAMDVPKPPPLPDGQEPLFEVTA